MIIDSKGKLFGKISIIDILILVVLIAGIDPLKLVILQEILTEEQFWEK